MMILFSLGNKTVLHNNHLALFILIEKYFLHSIISGCIFFMFASFENLKK